MDFLTRYDRDCELLSSLGFEKIEIGKTILNRPIFAFKLGCGRPIILAQYAIHAREHITYFLAIGHAKYLAKSYKNFGTIYIIPAVNIDGIALSIDGINTAWDYKESLLKLNNFSNDFSLWKANIRGVDLNTNFNARWGTGKQNIFYPNSQNFVGYSAESEPETKALVEFTKLIRPDITLSFHSKGEVIYYGFFEPFILRIKNRHIAKVIAHSTGYKIKYIKTSAGGYKDWCICKAKIPAVTIEVGADTLSHPIFTDHLGEIYQKTHKVFDDLLDYFAKFYYN